MLHDAHICLRRARSGDAATLKSILHDSYETTWLPQVKAEAAWAWRSQDRPNAYVAARGLRFWVAEVNGGIAGFIDWDGDFVNALHVLPAQARRGLGSKLMDKAEAAMVAAGFAEARLETDEFNVRSRAFYDRRGYREVDRYPDKEWNSGLTTLLLVKTLR